MSVENVNSTYVFHVEYRIFDTHTNEVLHFNAFTINPSSTTTLAGFLLTDFDQTTTHKLEATFIRDVVTGERIDVNFKNVFRPIDYSGITSSPYRSGGASPTHCDTKVLFVPNECDNHYLIRDNNYGYITSIEDCESGEQPPDISQDWIQIGDDIDGEAVMIG